MTTQSTPVKSFYTPFHTSSKSVLTLKRMLAALIVIGVLLRFLSAFLSLGSSHPNEFYRLLEPIADLEGYSTRLPWEWKDGLLSVLPVYGHHALLRFAALIGLHGAIEQLIFLKVLYAAMSLIPIWATWRLLRKYAFGWELYGAAFVSIWPEFIYRSVRLMDYSLEAALLALAVGISFGGNEKKLSVWMWAGFFLACAFFVRFQSGLYLVAFLLALLFVRVSQCGRFLAASALVASYGIGVFALAILESKLTHKPVLDPFFKYIDFNWTQDGAARLYGRAPWHRYLSESAKFFGFLPFMIGIVAMICSGAKKKLQWSLVILSLFPVLVLTLVSHKEGRFVYGCLWLLVPLTISALQGISFQRKTVIALGVLLIMGWGIGFSRIKEVYFAGSHDVRSWVDLSSVLSDSKSPLIVNGDPDFLPGGYFLRYHGPICYRFVREGKSELEGECTQHPDRNLVMSPSASGWRLE